MLDVHRQDPVFVHFEFNYETGGAEGKSIKSVASGDESGITSVSEKKLLVTRFFGSIQYTVSSEVFESEVSISKYFKLFPVLGFTRQQWKIFQGYQVQFYVENLRVFKFFKKINSRVLTAKRKRYKL